MDEIRIKTDKELLIEYRNQIASRIIEAKANIDYWIIIIRQSKSNSPEIVDALKRKQINEINIKKDTIFLKSIDKTLGGK